MAKMEITSPDGLRQSEVTADNEVVVSVATYPAFRPQKIQPFRQYFTADGTPSGSSDMGVDGSVTMQEFCIPADQDVDRYISNIGIVVGYGASAQPFNWADGAALTNGVRLYYSSSRGEVDIHEGIKSNQDMFRLSHEAVRSGWEVRGVNANNDYGYFITVDMENFMPPYGVKLDAGSNQKLVFSIRDNVGSTADAFNAIAYGFDRFE